MIYTYVEKMDFHRMALSLKPIRYVMNDNGCWICTSHTKDKDGYIKISRNKKYLRLHRYVYELEKGDIPKGYVVMHSCDDPSCFNPEHLSVGTQKDNNQDALKKKRNYIGVKNSSAKLDELEVLKIINDPRKCSEIAEEYGMHFSTIAAIKRGDIWGEAVKSKIREIICSS